MSIHRTSFLPLFTILMLIFFSGTISTIYSQNPFEIKSRISEKDSRDSSQSIGPSAVIPDIQTEPKEKNNESDHHATGKESNEAPAEILELKKDSDSLSPAASTSSETNKKSFIPLEMPVTSTTFPPGWYYIFDLILLLLLAGVFLYDKSIFPLIRKAFIHENFLRFLYRDTYLRKPGVFLFINTIFILGVGFYIFRISHLFGYENSLRQYLIIQGVTLFVITFKNLSLYLLSILVDNPFEVRFYQYWLILASGYIGIWLVPLILMISVLPPQFLHIALIITSILLATSIIYRLIKAFLHAKNYLSKHFLQIILYFCAIEIIPILIFLEVLTV